MNHEQNISKKIRIGLENLINSHLRIEDEELAIAIWFKKEDKKKVYLMEGVFLPGSHENKPQLPPLEIEHGSSALGWGISQTVHHVIIYSPKITLEYMIKKNDPLIKQLCADSEILYFNQEFLSPLILETFGIVVEPSNFIKGWYLEQKNLAEIIDNRNKIDHWFSSRPEIGIMQTSESTDFRRKVGIMHVEINGKWLPSTNEGVKSYSWYSDWVEGKPGYFLLRGGKIFKIEGFEIKRLPEVSKKVVESNAFDYYVEVYLSVL